MKYNYDDIFRLPLPPRYFRKFVESFRGRGDYENIIVSYETGQNTYARAIRAVVAPYPLEDYKSTTQYKNATTVLQRAVVAMRARPTKPHRTKVARFWTKAANAMTDLEKVMLGWDKV